MRTKTKTSGGKRYGCKPAKMSKGGDGAAFSGMAPSTKGMKRGGGSTPKPTSRSYSA